MSGRRKLPLTADVFIEFSKAVKHRAGFSRRFRVKENPLPDDARIVGVGGDGHMLALIIESDTWQQDDPIAIQLPPVFETVFDEEPK